MRTDISCEILCRDGEEREAEHSLRKAFDLFRAFEARYSRFQRENELWTFNLGETVPLSEEFFALLRKARYHHLATGGLFDPSILPSLEKEGYAGAYASDREPSDRKAAFSDLILDHETLTARKPQNLKIDLGGIGKGFIVDQVAGFLAERFENFLVDAGGDIFVRGANRKDGYDFWAIDLEHPLERDRCAATLLLKDAAVATSGINRRRWMKAGQEKHHIIDPKTGESAAPDFLSVTVIAPDAAAADVWAKALFIAGREKASVLAEKRKLPAIFIDTDANVSINSYAEPYVWKEE